MNRYIMFLFFCCFTIDGFSQFVKDDPVSTAIRDIIQGTADWGDFDNDGDLDLAICGVDGALHTEIYRNDEGALGTIKAGLPGLDMSTVSWGDFDNDNDLDLLLIGVDSEGTGHSIIYRNDDGTFVDHEAGLTGFHTGASEWGDFDSDGDLDIALIGKINGDNTRDYLKVYRNDAGTFIEVAVPVQPSAFNMIGSVTWGDYDSDNDLDLLVTGLGPNEAGDDLVTTIVRNNNGTFEASGIMLPGVANSSAAWGDYDQDGALDIAMQGVRFDNSYFTAILRNDGSSTFTNISASVNTVAQGIVHWEDFDGDGDEDLLLTGIDGVSFEPTTHIYRNDGGVLSETDDVLQGIWGSASWGDYDGDGDQDLLLNGVDRDFNFITDVYENTYKLYQNITFDAIADKTYGDADFELTATASSDLAITYELVSGPASLSGNMVTITGAGEVVVEASQAGNADYNPAEPLQQTITIGKASLTVSADDQTITYGDVLPALTFSYSGFVNGEDATVLNEEPAINTTAGAGSDAGTYPITLSGGVADNYEISLVNGVLTINKAVASITVGDLEHIYDGSVKEATIVTNPQNLNHTVTYNGESTPPMEVNTYDLKVVIDDINYQGEASETFSIKLISGRDDHINSDIVLYPIPADLELNFLGDLSKLGRVLIHDLAGKVMLNESIAGQRLDISHIDSGTYILNLTDDQGIKQFTKTIIIR